jgi:hypothetical protein
VERVRPYVREVVAVCLLVLLINFFVYILPVGLGSGSDAFGSRDHTAAQFSRAVDRMHAQGGVHATPTAPMMVIAPPKLRGPAQAARHTGLNANAEAEGAAAAAAAATIMATERWWTTEVRGVLAGYLGDNYAHGCSRDACVRALAGLPGHVHCCDAAPGVAVVARADLLARWPPASNALSVHHEVPAGGHVALWSRPAAYVSVLSCEQLVSIRSLPASARPARCQLAGTAAGAGTSTAAGLEARRVSSSDSDVKLSGKAMLATLVAADAAPAEKVPRPLPFYMVYRGQPGAPVCVSAVGRVRQMAADGRALGDELGRSCKPLSDTPLPDPVAVSTEQGGAASGGMAAAGGASVPGPHPAWLAAASAAEPRLLRRVVVLTQPMSHVPAHWATEAFLRVGAVWEAVAGATAGDVRVHVPAVNSTRVPTQLAGVGIPPDALISGDVCAHEVLVPMVAHCGQPIGVLAAPLRQITWSLLRNSLGAAAHTNSNNSSSSSSSAGAEALAPATVWAATAPAAAAGAVPTIVLLRRPRPATTAAPEHSVHEALAAFLRARTGATVALVEVSADPGDPVNLRRTLQALASASVVVAVQGTGVPLVYACAPGTLVIDIVLPRAARVVVARLAHSVGMIYRGLLPAGSIAATSEADASMTPEDYALLDALLRRHMPALPTPVPTKLVQPADAPGADAAGGARLTPTGPALTTDTPHNDDNNDDMDDDIAA